jgi:magnesium transporter
MIRSQLALHELMVEDANRAHQRVKLDIYDNVLFIDLRERLTAAFGASLLLSAARQNDIVKKLGSWAAILAVPTAIAGISGMNFKNMPELERPFGYPASLLLMLAICSTLYYCFRRAAWL